jgi:hypothetical protein
LLQKRLFYYDYNCHCERSEAISMTKPLAAKTPL